MPMFRLKSLYIEKINGIGGMRLITTAFPPANMYMKI